ncbi:hypothetical protein [Massilia endophytica]|uniref:hypothetical protein n=1 Tax=Massilia endophytica TaxID=2899220 RepID=UPI001E3CECC7|nr:hypothetical protein [Massilia endophytica]UGQ46764.1 hypothetical protein LSQ66_23875 [Massilia endophytica]
MNLSESSHIHTDDEYCPHCGQRLPPPGVSGLDYGSRKPNRVGIAVTVAVHLAIVLLFIINPGHLIRIKPPAKEGELVYIAPPAPAPKKAPAPTPRPDQKPQKREVAKALPKVLPRTNNEAITDPRKVQVDPTPAKELTPAPQFEDMQAMIEAARKRRGAQPSQSTDASVESDDARAKRIALANIMGAQGRSANGEKEDTGGIFDVQNKTFASADLKFRGWNTNFKRRWLSQVHVEVGNEVDIETAVAKKMIELIRKEKPGDFDWESHRLRKVVRMSARKEDEAELLAFLIQEMFPNYIKPARR